MLTRQRMIRRAKANGVLMPRRLYWAAKWADIPYSTACAYVMQETSGGKNEWGHDGGDEYPFCGHGDGIVTKVNYTVYRIEAERTGKRQGVGPLQLTHWSTQERADAMGGCWKPYINMKTAFEMLRGFITAGLSDREVAARYNGSESDGRYATELVGRLKFWRHVMKGLDR